MPELWAPASLALGFSALLSGPGEPGRADGAARRSAASRPAAVRTRGAGHCPAPAFMISAPTPSQASAAMFSFLVPGPATTASGSAPRPCFNSPKSTNACSRCNCHPCAGDSESPQAHERSKLLKVPFPSPLPPPLPSSSQSQSRRHLGSPLNSGARGHPGSSCRGGRLAPPFKETGARVRALLRQRRRSGGWRRVAEVAGAQGGGGTLVAPVTARDSLALPARTVVRAQGDVCVCRALCSSSDQLGDSKTAWSQPGTPAPGASG